MKTNANFDLDTHNGLYVCTSFFFEILKNKKKKLLCTFVDLEKAFDTVWRDALLYKMILNKMNGNT